MKIQLLMILLLGLSACTASMSPEEIENKVIQANTNLDSYKISSEIEILTEGAENNIQMNMNLVGEINREDKMGHVLSDTTMNFLDNEASFSQESYIDGNKVYTKFQDRWIMMEVENSWDEQDQAAQYTELIQNGEMDLKGSETIDGNKYYVVEMTLDKKFLEAYTSTTGQELSGIDFADYDITFYVNAETFVIERNEGELVISQIVEDEEIKMNMDISTKLYDINVPNSITIPDVALMAEEYES